MAYGSSRNYRQKIADISKGNPDGEGNPMENDLQIGVVGADVKHICVSVRTGQDVYDSGDEAGCQQQAAGKKDFSAVRYFA